MKTGAKGLFAIGSLLYISYSKNKTTILWLVDGSKSGCCRSISCNQQQQQQNDMYSDCCMRTSYYYSFMTVDRAVEWSPEKDSILGVN